MKDRFKSLKRGSIKGMSISTSLRGLGARVVEVKSGSRHGTGSSWTAAAADVPSSRNNHGGMRSGSSHGMRSGSSHGVMGEGSSSHGMRNGSSHGMMGSHSAHGTAKKPPPPQAAPLLEGGDAKASMAARRAAAVAAATGMGGRSGVAVPATIATPTTPTPRQGPGEKQSALPLPARRPSPTLFRDKKKGDDVRPPTAFVPSDRRDKPPTEVPSDRRGMPPTLPALLGSPANDDNDGGEKDSGDDDDDVSIMGMSAEGDIVEEDDDDDDDDDDGLLETHIGDLWDEDGYRVPDGEIDGRVGPGVGPAGADGSTVSDDDYYKQDYYSMLVADDNSISQKQMEVSSILGDEDQSEITSLSSHILEEMSQMAQTSQVTGPVTRGGGGPSISAEELRALTLPDRVGSGRRVIVGAQELSGPRDLGVGAAGEQRKDYGAFFDKMLQSTPPIASPLEASPDKEESRQEEAEMHDDVGEGGAHDDGIAKVHVRSHMDGGGGESPDAAAAATAPDQNEAREGLAATAPHRTSNVAGEEGNTMQEDGGGGQLANPAAARDSPSAPPTPAVAEGDKPGPSEVNCFMVPNDEVEFATMLRRAGNELGDGNGTGDGDGNEFAIAASTSMAGEEPWPKPQGSSAAMAINGKGLGSSGSAFAPLRNSITPQGDTKESSAMMTDISRHAMMSPLLSPEGTPANSPEKPRRRTMGSDTSSPPTTPLSHRDVLSPSSHASNSVGGTTGSHASSQAPATSSRGSSKLLKENNKLRKRRKELLALLSSTAQQFSAYERVCSSKINALEMKNRKLEADMDGRRDPHHEAVESAEAVAEAEGMPGGGGGGGDSPMSAASGKKYDGAIVMRLSSGVLMQEKQLKAKDELITQLKLRCEVLKQTLIDKDSEIVQEKKTWEEERVKLLKNLNSSSPVKLGHGELMTKRMQITRLKLELETALSDITMLTTALETNNEALDATVLELDRLKEWKANYGEAAASVVKPPPETPGAAMIGTAISDVEKLRFELKEKDVETSQLQDDLESSLNEIEELRAEVNEAAAAQGLDHFKEEVEGLKREVEASRGDAERARERAKELEEELEGLRAEAAARTASHDGDEAAPTTEYPADEGYNGSASAEGEEQLLSAPMEDIPKRNLFGRLTFSRQPNALDADEAGGTDYRTMVRQRDLKIKSLNAMIHSNSMIMEKLKTDIERMDTEREESEFLSSQRIEKLETENKAYEKQVAGFEKAFMNLKGNGDGGVSLGPTQNEEDGIIDDAMFMWDDNEEGGGNEANEDESDDLISKSLKLQRMVTELESGSSFQEDQIERLRAELVRLRVTSQQEKEKALERLSEEKKIVVEQRSALEDQLADINKSAGALREKLSTPGKTPHTSGNGDNDDGGGNPSLVAQVVMLEKANTILKKSVESLRSDTQEKLAPLLERIALLEEEARMMEEETATKLSVREVTIMSLENSVQQLQRARRFNKKGRSMHNKSAAR